MGQSLLGFMAEAVEHGSSRRRSGGSFKPGRPSSGPSPRARFTSEVGLTLDAGPSIAAERDNRAFWKEASCWRVVPVVQLLPWPKPGADFATLAWPRR
jgi:hypothetical protein